MFLKGLLFLALFYVVNQVHFPWQTGIPGVAPINIIVGLAVVVMWNKPDPLVKTQAPILLRPMAYFWGAMTFAFVVAQVMRPGDFILDATYLKNAIFFQLFYLIFLYCRQDEETTRLLIIWIMVIAALAGFEAVREGLDYGIGTYNPMRRASGPFGTDWRHANRAGVFYGMFFPMFAALAFFLRDRKLWRIAAIGGICMMVGGALFTYSRQSYFLILLALVILLVRKSLAYTVVMGVLLLSLSSYLPDSVTQRVDETKQTSKTGETEVDASTASRWEIWAGAMGMWGDNPIGVGLNRFKWEIGKYCSHKGMDAHNFYVLTLAETGPVGLAMLFYLLYVIFFKLARYLREKTPPDEPELNALTIGFQVMVINTALGAIYGSPTLEGSVMAPFWALAGLLERYVQLKAQNKGQAQTQAPREPTLVQRFPLAAYIRPGRRM